MIGKNEIRLCIMTSSNEQRPALVVLDMIAIAQFLGKHVFRTIDSATFDQAISRNNALISAFSAKGLPVFIMNLELTGLLKSFNGRLFRPLLSNEALAAGTVLAKHGPSGFAQSELYERLTAQNINALYVTGFSTDNAVKKTVADAEQLGFEAVVVKDASLARNSELQAQMIRDFDEVISAERLLRELG